VQPSSPNISEQTAQYLAIFVPEKESDRIPFRLSGARNAIVIDNRLYDVAVIGGIRIENYSKVVHNKRFPLVVPGQLLGALFPNHIKLKTESGELSWHTTSETWIPEDGLYDHLVLKLASSIVCSRADFRLPPEEPTDDWRMLVSAFHTFTLAPGREMSRKKIKQVVLLGEQVN
jgi:hypothetical protein